MSDDEIKIKVHESLGWTKRMQGPTHYAYSRGDYWHYLHEVPNYPLDLNACAEFEAALTDDEWDMYCENLGGSLRACASATASQRCLAYLKVKGILP